MFKPASTILLHVDIVWYNSKYGVLTQVSQKVWWAKLYKKYLVMRNTTNVTATTTNNVSALKHTNPRSTRTALNRSRMKYLLYGKLLRKDVTFPNVIYTAQQNLFGKAPIIIILQANSYSNFRVLCVIFVQAVS